MLKISCITLSILAKILVILIAVVVFIATEIVVVVLVSLYDIQQAND